MESGGCGAASGPGDGKVQLDAQLLSLLCANDYGAVHALLTVSQRDLDLPVQLVNYFASHETKLLPLIRSLLAAAVSKAGQQENTLFRSGSSMKLLSLILRDKGKDYITGLLEDTIKQICQKPPVVELDRGRWFENGKQFSLEENAKNLGELCSTVLHKITSSVEDSPVFIRQVATMVHILAAGTFSHSKQITESFSDVGGFLFLRFFCVALVQPEELITDLGTPSDAGRRVLILISKVLQALANGVLFGQSEDFMVVMNPFLQQHQPDMVAFLKNMSSLALPKEAAECESRAQLKRQNSDCSLHLALKIHKLQSEVKEELSRMDMKDIGQVLDILLKKWPATQIQGLLVPQERVREEDDPGKPPDKGGRKKLHLPQLPLKPFLKNKKRTREDVRAQIDALKEQRRKLDEQISKLEAEYDGLAPELPSEVSADDPKERRKSLRLSSQKDKILVEKVKKETIVKTELEKRNERKARRSSTGEITLQDIILDRPPGNEQRKVEKLEHSSPPGIPGLAMLSPSPRLRSASHGETELAPRLTDMGSPINMPRASCVSSSDEIPFLDAPPITPRRKRMTLAGTKDSPLFESTSHVRAAYVNTISPIKLPSKPKMTEASSLRDAARQLKKALGKKWSGQELLQWVKDNTSNKEEESATAFCGGLLKEGLVKQVRKGGRKRSLSTDMFGPDTIFESV